MDGQSNICYLHLLLEYLIFKIILEQEQKNVVKLKSANGKEKQRQLKQTHKNVNNHPFISIL